MLIQIGDNWIDPAEIVSVTPEKPIPGITGIDNRVCVGWGRGENRCGLSIKCDSFGGAVELAARIANKVNDALKEKPPCPTTTS